MNENQAKSVVNYLRRADSNVDETHVKEIHHRYRRVLELAVDAVLPEDVNEEALTQVAQQLNLRIDTTDAKDYLRECVKYADLQDAVAVVFGKLAGEEVPMDLPEPSVIVVRSSTPSVSRVTQHLPHTTNTDHVIPVTDVDCLLTVKMATTEVDRFIETFLLQDVKALCQPVAT